MRGAARAVRLAIAATGRDRRPQPHRLRLGTGAPGRTAPRLSAAFRTGAVHQARSGGGSVMNLLGEVHGKQSALVAEDIGLEERIEAALEASGRSWKRREGSWVVPANERLPREIR